MFSFAMKLVYKCDEIWTNINWRNVRIHKSPSWRKILAWSKFTRLSCSLWPYQTSSSAGDDCSKLVSWTSGSVITYSNKHWWYCSAAQWLSGQHDHLTAKRFLIWVHWSSVCVNIYLHISVGFFKLLQVPPRVLRHADEVN